MVEGGGDDGGTPAGVKPGDAPASARKATFGDFLAHGPGGFGRSLQDADGCDQSVAIGAARIRSSSSYALGPV